MRETIIRALKNLEIKSDAANNMRAQVLELNGRKEEASAFITRLEVEGKLNNCTLCDGRHFCNFFLACAYNELGNHSQTQQYLLKAIKNFKQIGSTWNETMVNWIYGESLLALRRYLPAQRELEKTIELLDGIAKKHHRERRYEKRDECIEYIIKIKEKVLSIEHEKLSKAVKQKPVTKKVHPSSTTSPLPHSRPAAGRRSPIVFPVYSQIRAGQEGNFIFESEASPDASFDELYFNEILHSIYNTRDEGAPIIFYPKVHRWFQIDGDSMNKADPVPIENKDFVLAIDSWEPSTGDIVIAELHSPSDAERAGVVKRFTQKGLQSLSSNDYPIIPLGRVATFRGVVIAVAKPNSWSKREETKAERENMLDFQEDAETEALFDDLLAKAFHDKETAIRLINFEKERSPDASLKTLIQNAIDRWHHDNRSSRIY